MAGAPSLSSAGLVGISLTSAWGEPVDLSNKKDVDAAERYLQFSLGWFANPIFHGDYPEVMKNYIGKTVWLDLCEGLPMPFLVIIFIFDLLFHMGQVKHTAHLDLNQRSLTVLNKGPYQIGSSVEGQKKM